MNEAQLMLFGLFLVAFVGVSVMTHLGTRHSVPEPRIPTAMEDWDEAFQEAGGVLPLPAGGSGNSRAIDSGELRASLSTLIAKERRIYSPTGNPGTR